MRYLTLPLLVVISTWNLQKGNFKYKSIRLKPILRLNFDLSDTLIVGLVTQLYSQYSLEEIIQLNESYK